MNLLRGESLGYQISTIGPIPEDWEVAKLGEVVEIYDHKRIPLSEMERSKRKGNYPYCGANGVIDFIDDYIFDGEYVLLAEDGGDYVRFGSSAYIMSGKFWVNNHAHVLKALESKLNNWFLMYLLNFLDLSPYIVGSTRTKLNQDQMRNIKLLLPPLPEQKRIAEVLRTVDEAIEKVEQEIDHTERLKKGLMQRLLTHGIGHTWFKDSPLGKIPESWEVIRLKDVTLKMFGGGTPSTAKDEYWNGEIPWMTSAHISGMFITDGQRYISHEGLKNSSTNLVPKGNLVIATRVGIGKVAVNLIDIAISQDLTGVIVDKYRALPEYLYWFLSFHHLGLKKFAQGSTIKGVLRSSLANLQIPLPPLPEQKKIVEILMTVDMKIELLKNKKEHLERLKKGLMNDLLTGRRRLKVVSKV